MEAANLGRPPSILPVLEERQAEKTTAEKMEVHHTLFEYFGFVHWSFINMARIASIVKVSFSLSTLGHADKSKGRTLLAVDYEELKPLLVFLFLCLLTYLPGKLLQSQKRHEKLLS